MRGVLDLLRPGVAVGARVCDRCARHTGRVSHVQADIYLASIRAGDPFLPCWCGGRLMFAEPGPRRRVAREVAGLVWATFAPGPEHTPEQCGAPGSTPGTPPLTDPQRKDDQ